MSKSELERSPHSAIPTAHGPSTVIVLAESVQQFGGLGRLTVNDRNDMLAQKEMILA
ncbi:unnamed protein product, partial [Amoebophrya sp. A25]